MAIRGFRRADDLRAAAGPGAWRVHSPRGCFRGFLGFQPAEQPAKETERAGSCACCRRGRASGSARALRPAAVSGTMGAGWSGTMPWTMACGRSFFARLPCRAPAVLGLRHHLVAGRHVLHLVQLVVLQALHLVVRRLEVRIRHQHDVDLDARFQLLDLGALLVQQEGGHVDRHLRVHGAGVFLHRFFLDDAQHVQRRRFGAADEAGAAAARAADVRGFLERRLQPLARQLHQAEARDLADLHARAVVAQRFAEAVLDFALVLLRLHVDEVHHDQAAQVAQPQLAGDFLGRLQVGAEAVSSMSWPLVARAELTSIETSASVWSITIAPPEGRLTCRP
jgi:hypothetical protein